MERMMILASCNKSYCCIIQRLIRVIGGQLVNKYQMKVLHSKMESWKNILSLRSNEVNLIS